MPKLNLVSTLAAFVLFFLPWIDLRCSGRSIAMQSGVQAAYGGFSVPKELEGVEDRQRDQTKSADRSREFSLLIAFAFLLTVAALVVSAAQFRGWPPVPDRLPAVLCAVALILVVIQIRVGFPIQTAIAEMLRERATGGPEAKFAAAAMTRFEVGLRPALYLEMLALAVPVLAAGNRWLDRKAGR